MIAKKLPWYGVLLLVPSLAGLLLLIKIGVVQGQDLGRLFLTPEQRQRLEALRHRPPPSEPRPAPQAAPVVVEPEIPDPSITVSGIVTRSGGKSTAWVNGMNTYEGDLSSQNIRVDPRAIYSDSVPVQLPNQRGTVRLKPGQSYDPAAKAVQDGVDAVQKASPQPAAP